MQHGSSLIPANKEAIANSSFAFPRGDYEEGLDGARGLRGLSKHTRKP